MTRNFLIYFPQMPDTITFPNLGYYHYAPNYGGIAHYVGSNRVLGDLCFDEIGTIEYVWDLILNVPFAKPIEQICPFSSGYGMFVRTHDFFGSDVVFSLFLELLPNCKVFYQNYCNYNPAIEDITEKCRQYPDIIKNTAKNCNIFVNSQSCIIFKHLIRKTVFYPIEFVPQDLKEVHKSLRGFSKKK